MIREILKLKEGIINAEVFSVSSPEEDMFFDKVKDVFKSKGEFKSKEEIISNAIEAEKIVKFEAEYEKLLDKDPVLFFNNYFFRLTDINDIDSREEFLKLIKKIKKKFFTKECINEYNKNYKYQISVSKDITEDSSIFWNNKEVIQIKKDSKEKDNIKILKVKGGRNNGFSLTPILILELEKFLK